MGIATATLEMRTPEETRERLHELVKATRTVIVLHATAGSALDEPGSAGRGTPGGGGDSLDEPGSAGRGSSTPGGGCDSLDEPGSAGRGSTPGGECGSSDGRPMALVKTGDDTTMYLATSLEAGPAEELARNPRVTVVLQGAGYALLTGEATLSRDRALIDQLWVDTWRQWARGKADPTLAIVIVSPIEGSYWEGSERQSYVYRIVDDGG